MSHLLLPSHSCVFMVALLPESFWGHNCQHVFDFRVFCSPSSTSISQSLMSWYRINEEIKKNKYNQRIRTWNTPVSLLSSSLHLVALDQYPPCSLNDWLFYTQRNSNVPTVQLLISFAVTSPFLFKIQP